MDLRNQVKHVLRHCGHALVSTVHDRLNGIECMLQQILEQNTHIASTQTALLQSGVHLVENMARVRSEIAEAEGRVSMNVRDHAGTKLELQALAAAIAELREAGTGKADFQELRDRIAILQDILAELCESGACRADFQELGDRIAILQDILAQNTEIAGTQTALLQSSVETLGNLSQLRARIDEIETRIAARVREYCATRSDAQALGAAIAAAGEVAAGKAELGALEQRIQDFSQGIRDALNANLQAVYSVNGGIEKTQEAGVAAVQSGVEKMLDLSNAMRQSTAASLAVLEPAAHQTREFLANQSVRQVCVETSDYFFTNPELGLMSFLYSYLPTRTVLDVGAHIGDVSEHLLNTGYEVYAFEPFPESYQRLTERLGCRPAFHGFNLALGSVTGELPLYTVRDSSPDNRYEDPTVFHSLAPHGMPEGLAFENAIPVPIRKLSELHREGLVPTTASLVKIDTEGYDYEVVLGMDDQRYPVVMIEFWDSAIPFATQGLRYTVKSMVREMRQRGYLWSIVIYRIWGQNETAFFCNQDHSVPGSWGNVLFFREREIFVQAQQWCSAVLPRTYFKHTPASPESMAKETEGSIRKPRLIGNAPGRHR
jgi:FkbM family methyltransferase